MRERIFTTRSGPNTRVAADHLYKIIKKEKTDRDVSSHDLLPSLVACVCSAIESRINDAIILHLYTRFGKQYKSHARQFLLWNIEVKLREAIPIISDYRYEVDFSSPRIQFLLKVFRLRNRLIHEQDHLVPAELEQLPDGSARCFYDDAEARWHYSSDEWKSVTKKDLRSIHKLLDEYMPLTSNLYRKMKTKRFKPKEYFKAIQPNQAL